LRSLIQPNPLDEGGPIFSFVFEGKFRGEIENKNKNAQELMSKHTHAGHSFTRTLTVLSITLPPSGNISRAVTQMVNKQ
jgi:hypothetical protein